MCVVDEKIKRSNDSRKFLLEVAILCILNNFILVGGETPPPKRIEQEPPDKSM